MAPIVPKPETTAPTSGKKKPIEVEEEKPEKESVDEELESEPEEEEEDEDGEEPEEDEEESESEPDEDEEFTGVAPPEEETEEEPEEEDASLTPDDIEKPSLKDQFHEKLITRNTSEIHTRISNDFPSKSRTKTESIDALIECLNANETSESYIEEGFGIINQLHNEFTSNGGTLAQRFSAYVKQNLSENLRRILFKEGEDSGKEIPMNLEQKKRLINSKKVINYIIDKNKIDEIDDFRSLLNNVEAFLQEHGERNVRPLKKISRISKINNVDARNLLIKMITDDMGNYVYLTEDDIRKIENI
jgi:hypothetical protein